MKSIFISRRLERESPFFKRFKREGTTVIDLPLINIAKIPFSFTPQTQWIFFSSKNSIKYFFDQNPSLPQNVKYGVIGSSSAMELKKHGREADFAGQGVDLVKIARQFREVLGNDSVLFPQAMDSLQTIQKQLAFTNTIYNLYTYKTILRTDFELPYTDVVVFTSPSNVKAYFSKYTLDSRQTIIAMGASTKYALAERGHRDVLIPNEFSEEGLCNLIANN